jgi:hypothetical protein
VTAVPRADAMNTRLRIGPAALGGTGTNTVPSPVGPYNIWEQVLARIEKAIQPHTYFAFFRDTVLVSDDAVIIRVRVRSSDAGEWIAKHHADALRETLAGVRVRGCRY